MSLNDIPVITSPFSQRPVSTATATYKDFKPLKILTIGKRNDLPKGFSAFDIGDMQFWDKFVYGMPFQSIGKRV